MMSDCLGKEGRTRWPRGSSCVFRIISSIFWTMLSSSTGKASQDIQSRQSCLYLLRPGIKTKKTLHSAINLKKISAQNELLKKTIFPEIKKLYGARKGCEMF